MKLTGLDDVIDQTESVEDEVLALIELEPRLIKSPEMLQAVNHLKKALDSLRSVRRAVGMSPNTKHLVPLAQFQGH
jgi:predicted RND superfamily exporter protein